MELEKINIAIVGFGNIGSYFYKILEKNISSKSSMKNIEISSNKFGELVEKIIKKNYLRAYPDINDIPN